MSTWIFEPGHTEAEFRARHMMVTWVRGLFKDIHGRLELDFNRCLEATFQGEIDAGNSVNAMLTVCEHTWLTGRAPPASSARRSHRGGQPRR